MFSCLIVEDDYSFGISVKIQVQELGLKVTNIVSTIEEIKEALESNHVDLILSDIKLKNGEYSYEYFAESKTEIPIIFFSALKDNALYDKTKCANPYIILTKPLDDNSFKSAVFGALKEKMDAKEKGGEIERTDKTIFIRNKGKLISIDSEQVAFVKSEGNHCFINLDTKKIAIRSSLKNIQETLNNPSLIQVQRAYLVNLKYITDVNIGTNILQISETSIPIGRKYKRVLIESIKNNMTKD